MWVDSSIAAAAISFVRSENAPLSAYFAASCLTELSANWLTNCVAIKIKIKIKKAQVVYKAAGFTL